MSFDVHSLYNRKRNHRWDRVSVGDMLERVSLGNPNQEAIVAWKGAFAYPEFERVSYYEADNLANRFANALLDAGLNRGDRVFFFCDNSVEAYLAKIGVAKAGMVNVPVNTMLADDVLEYILDLTEPQMIIVDDEHLNRVQKVVEQKQINIDVVIPIKGNIKFNECSFKNFVKDVSQESPEIEIHGDDIWEILFTSGTTSMPKGVMISHHYTYFAAYNYGMKLATSLFGEWQYKVISFLPAIYHVADQTLPGSAFLTGGTFIMGRNYDIKHLCQAISQEKPTALWAGSAAMVYDLVDYYHSNGNTLNFSSLTSILYGYAALDPKYHDALKEICGQHVNVFESFAQTEAIAGYRFPHDRYPATYRKFAPFENYVGIPDPSLAALIVDENDQLINEPYEQGEIVYRSPINFSGYYKDPHATEQALRNGWFHSGDRGMYDENGLVVMVDRIKNMIKTGGESVSTLRVEAAISSHPSIKRAAVIGIKDEKWDEMVVGIVVLKEGEVVSEEELIQFCRQELAGYETPKRIFFRNSLPETVAGKVMKFQLASEYRQLIEKERQ